MQVARRQNRRQVPQNVQDRVATEGTSGISMRVLDFKIPIDALHPHETRRLWLSAHPTLLERGS